jgi:hypothetical protein
MLEYLLSESVGVSSDDSNGARCLDDTSSKGADDIMGKN